MQPDSAQVATTLARRFRAATRRRVRGAEQARRTVRQLLIRAAALRDVHLRKKKRKAAKARWRREAAAAGARAKQFDALAGRKAAAWKDVGRLVASKKPKSYGQGVVLLVDLSALAAREGDERGFARRLTAIRNRHACKPGFIVRLKEAGLEAGTP